MSTNTVFNTTADRYAALKDLDEQLRDDKSVFQTQSVQEQQQQQQKQQNPFKQNGNLHPNGNPFQFVGETKVMYGGGAIDTNDRYDGSNDFSQMHQRNPFQVSSKICFWCRWNGGSMVEFFFDVDDGMSRRLDLL